MTLSFEEQQILDYLREEFEMDPELSRSSVADIAAMFDAGDELVLTTLDSLIKKHLVQRFSDHNENPRPDEFQATGAKIVWEDS